MRRFLPILLAFLAVFVLSILGVSSSHAQSTPTTLTPKAAEQIFIVDYLFDEAHGICKPNQCSLRDAIDMASSGATINFATNLTGTMPLNGSLNIVKDVAIHGPGQGLVITGGQPGIYGMFIITATTFSISDLTIADSFDGFRGSGGAIYNESGKTTITDVKFQHNYAGDGGAIFNNKGNLIIINSVFDDNRAVGGGAITTLFGDTKIERSIFTTNHATSGGAISISTTSGIMAITNSKFEGNSATNATDIENYGLLTISDSVFITTSIGLRSSILSIGTAKTTLVKTQLINTSTGLNCSGKMIDGGGNLQFPGSDCGQTIPIGTPLPSTAVSTQIIPLNITPSSKVN